MLALWVMLSDALNDPAVSGVQVTLKVQVPAAASAPAQVSVTLNAVAFAPVMVRLKVAPTALLFCTVTLTAADFAGAAGGVVSTTEPRFKAVPDAGVAVIVAVGATAVQLKG